MGQLFVRKHFLLVVLAVVSSLLYLVDYAMLGSVREVVVGFLGNLAFLPVYVIFVAVMFEQISRERERQAIMSKMNMVIGVFFSEVGNRLLRELSAYVVMCDNIRRELRVTPQWKDTDFRKALVFLNSNDPKIECAQCNKQALKEFLLSKRSFLVGLLENQSLLEHDQFTDLLWAVFHLVEELDARESLENMPKSDIDHINGDIKRAFGHLSREWVSYMKHLKQDYPYLFSLAVRLNPMVDTPDPHVY
ncbi:MAG: hypothetical protein HXX11_13155 [Desulfuromonadales bacterium]|nr:hypothetical protein [Desulfuromonadales bacterium]